MDGIPPDTLAAVARALPGALFDTVGDDLLLVSHTGAVLACNDGFLAFHGLRSRAECPAHREDFADLLEMYTPAGEPVPSAHMPLARALRGERCRDVTLRIRHLRRGGWWVRRLSASPLLDGAGRLVGALLTARDVTSEQEALRREARLERELSLLRQRHAAVRVAVGATVLDGAALAHDLRNPMQVLLAALPGLALDPLSARQQELVARLHRASTLLADMLEGMLALARAHGGGRNGGGPQAPVSLAGVLDTIAQLYGAQLAGIGVRLQLHAPPARHDVVTTQGEALRRVLMNLVANAAKFTRAGTITVRLRVEPAAEVEGPTLEGTAATLHGEVADTGIGIAEAHQGALFAPYVQAPGGAGVSHGGSGLGLAICRELVSQLGGTIALRSREGVGTTVSFALPVALAQPVAGGHPPHA